MAVNQLKELLQGGGDNGGEHLLFEVQGNLAQLLLFQVGWLIHEEGVGVVGHHLKFQGNLAQLSLDVPDDLPFGGGGEGVVLLEQHLLEVG